MTNVRSRLASLGMTLALAGPAAARLTNGYVRIRMTSGDDRFVAYGVVNDGASSSSGTNDGSYVAMSVTN